MATLQSLQDELAQVSAAISAAYTGQEYEIEGAGSRRRLKRADLKTLLARKSELELAISRLDGSAAAGGRGVRNGVPMP
jgi:hypothetical protein